MALSPYPWLENEAQQLNEARESLPNAILLHGPRGSGAFELALRFAESLLCERPETDGAPCGHCKGCSLIAAKTHPDIQIVVSEYLAQTYDLPYVPAPGARKTATLSREIRIHQSRALTDFVNMASNQGGRRVVVVYPADMIGDQAAASLLKNIEEPPEGLVYLLVADDIDKVLPTIRSRSRLIRIGLPKREEALAWLEAQKVTHPETRLALAGGSPLRATDDRSGLEVSDAMREQILTILRQGAAIRFDDVLRAFGRKEGPSVPAWSFFLSRWLFDILLVGQGLAPRYFIDEKATLEALATKADPRAVMSFADEVNLLRQVAEHPLNANLMWATYAFKYSAAVMPGRG